MEERKLSDKNKNIVAVFSILVFGSVLFSYLFFSTNLFNFDSDSVAQIRKVEKKLADIEIPDIQDMGLDYGEDYDEQESFQGFPSPPAILDYNFIAHSTYHAFAEAEFSLSENSVSVSDDIIYNTGYYSVNGAAWQQFPLQGTSYGGGHPWLLASGTSDLPVSIEGEGTHYIIIFSCTLEGESWDCHGDLENGQIVSKWQLRVIDNGNNNPGCADTCSSLGYTCGTHTICGESVYCGNCNPNTNSDLDFDHLHLMWENSEQTDTSIDIIWDEPMSASSNSRVYYDTNSRNCEISQYSSSVLASSSVFSEMNARVRHAGLRNLQPDTTYFFCIENDGEHSEEYHFRTAPSSGTDFTFIMGGDTQGRAESGDFHDLTREAMAEEPLFILHSGDGSQNAKADDWDHWLNGVEDFKTSSGRLIPMIPAVGGHDIYQGGDIFWHAYYTLPGDELHFYHDIGDLRVVTLYLPDSEKSSLNVPAQVSLLTSSLQGARAEGKWTLVQYHDPMYPSQKPVTNDARRMREYWEPVFDEYEVPLVLEGANHVYKRTYPIRNEQITDIFSGTVHIGDGGWPASRTGIADGNEQFIEEYAYGPQVAVVEMSSRPYNANDQSTWMQIHVINEEGQTIDQVNIPK